MKLQWGILLAAAIELAVLVNLIILDIVLLSPKKTSQTVTALPSSITCGEDCSKQIQEQVSSVVAALPLPSSSTTLKTAAKTTKSSVKEFFIPLGSGSTTNDAWEDITGAEAYIDTNSYTNIQTVYFETSMHIPTKNGIVYARLYNVTDKHPVWFSEVSTDSDTGKLVTAQIKLDSGNKQYRVQMKTSLKYSSLLDFARVKIITK